MLGVDYLHKLAETHAETHKEKPERIQQVVDVFLSLYADTKSKVNKINIDAQQALFIADTKSKVNKINIDAQRALFIKKVLLEGIKRTIREGSIYSKEQKQKLQNVIEIIEKPPGSTPPKGSSPAHQQ